VVAGYDSNHTLKHEDVAITVAQRVLDQNAENLSDSSGLPTGKVDELEQ
jgi:hypothetical protein